MPEQDKQITALADRYYDRLLRAGEQGLALNPIVHMTAPAQALVLWETPGRVLEGYEVSKTDWDSVFDNREYERIGFDAEAQRAGIWALHGVRFEPRAHETAGGWNEAGSASHLFANYDPVEARWRVVRLKPGQPPSGEWADQWQPMDDHLRAEERAVIARVGQETEMLLDVAVTLRDDPEARAVLKRVLMQRAQESADPGDRQRIGAVLRPYDYLPAPVANQFRISSFGSNLAGPLYRALSGRAPRDSTAIMATAGVTEAGLCPPYEPVTFGLSRDPGHPPAGTRTPGPRPARRRHPRRLPPGADGLTRG